MKMKTILTTITIALLAGAAEAKTIRATEMGASVWSDLAKGTLSDIIVEFRQGDELPVSFVAEGDLVETTQNSTSYIGVKRNFWLKVKRANVLMSLDNITYKDISDVISGSFMANAGAGQNGGIANTLNLAFKAYLK
ncbi:MAG: hypothetical protein V4654_13350 [Bdellovibrionota bacterium]